MESSPVLMPKLYLKPRSLLIILLNLWLVASDFTKRKLMKQQNFQQCQFFESEDEGEMDKLVQSHTRTTEHAEFTVSTTPTARWSVTS
jgi:hypothetical protein